MIHSWSMITSYYQGKLLGCVKVTEGFLWSAGFVVRCWDSTSVQPRGKTRTKIVRNCCSTRHGTLPSTVFSVTHGGEGCDTTFSINMLEDGSSSSTYLTQKPLFRISLSFNRAVRQPITNHLIILWSHHLTVSSVEQ